MNLKGLSNIEILAVSGPWVDEKRQRAVFLSIPEIAGLLPHVERVHKGMLGTRQPSGSSAAMQAILDEETQVDSWHDHAARAHTSLFEAQIALALARRAPDHKRAEVLERISGAMFPNGLLIVNASLQAESGNTERVAQLLKDDPEIVAVLKSIPTRKAEDGKKAETLHDVTLQWIKDGARLGVLEHQRMAQETTENAEAITQPKATSQELRNAWIKVVSKVLSNLELASAPAKDIKALTMPVEEAMGRAERRLVATASDEREEEDGAADGAGAASEVAGAKVALDGKTTAADPGVKKAGPPEKPKATEEKTVPGDAAASGD